VEIDTGAVTVRLVIMLAGFVTIIALAALGVFAGWKLVVLAARMVIVVDRAIFGAPKRNAPARPQAPFAFSQSAPEETYAPPAKGWGRSLRPEARLTIGFTYCDADGEVTQRKVKMLSVTGATAGAPEYLHGFCMMRRAERTFRLGRMIDVHLADTGEMLDNPSAWLAARVLEVVPS
jgi:hypothetical protein